MRFRIQVISRLGIALLGLGVVLRLGARWLAWPENWRYNGPQAETEWAIEELAFDHISMVLMILGSVLIVLAAYAWLFPPVAQTRTD